MKTFPEFLASGEYTADPRALRTDRRLVNQLAKAIGTPPKSSAWPDLINRLRGFSRSDWNKVALQGASAVPELAAPKKKKAKPPTPPTE